MFVHQLGIYKLLTKETKQIKILLQYNEHIIGMSVINVLYSLKVVYMVVEKV